MENNKLEFLKEKLDEEALSSDQWDDWLEQASETCFAARLVLEKFEPYATLDIQSLKNAEAFLLGLKEELEEAKE